MWVEEQALHFLVWVKWGLLYLFLSFVVSGVRSLVSGLDMCAFLPFYFSLSLSLSPLFLCAALLFIWKTYIDSPGVFLDRCVNKKRALKLKKPGAVPAVNRLPFILGWVRDGSWRLLVPKGSFHYLGNPIQHRIIKSYQIFLSLSLHTGIHCHPILNLAWRLSLLHCNTSRFMNASGISSWFLRSSWKSSKAGTQEITKNMRCSPFAAYWFWVCALGRWPSLSPFWSGEALKF